MLADSAFLPRILCLQICDRNFRCRGAFAGRALRRVRKCRCVSEFSALGRLKVSAGDIESSRRGHDDTCPNREHIALVQTAACRIGRAVAVARIRKAVAAAVSAALSTLQAARLPLQIRSMQLQSDQLLQRLKPLFLGNFEKLGELGAAVSVWQNGKPIIDLYGGFRDALRENPWTSDTLVLVWSATKGIGSACVLHAMQEHKITLDRRVAEFWPEFAQAGKEKITLAQLLSHQAGLCALDRRVDVLDYDAVIRALEAQKPLWTPGTAHGYHARTFGFLFDDLVRRITGKTLSEY